VRKRAASRARSTPAQTCALCRRRSSPTSTCPPVRVVRAAGFQGRLAEVTLYHCEVELDGHRIPHVEALETHRTYALVGRNVLSRFVVRLDGPKGTLTLTKPRG
jgi:hypothetical protein